MARRLCGPDHRHADGFVAERLGGPEDGRIVGHLCLEPIDDDTEEVAVAVADEYRHQGIGGRLLDTGIAVARAMGIAVVHATALADNTAILHLLGGVSPDVRFTQRAGGTIDVDIPLGVTRDASPRRTEGPSTPRPPSVARSPR